MMESLEHRLDSFDRAERDHALRELWRLAGQGAIKLPQPGRAVNLHSHTFYSYNAYGYSPSKFAWLARKRGLAVAGIVDFDSLDGLEEFLAAGRMIGLKTCVSLESRTYVPEFADRVINSPGEPGVAYNMGVGFTRLESHPTLARMRAGAEERNRGLMARVNAYLRPVEIDYERDVLPLTPEGNATERHLAIAFESRARQMFPDSQRRSDFWEDRLGRPTGEGARLQALIRTRTMKQGGAGYVQPGKESFPLMAEMNRYVMESGAIPTIAWLDGTSEGEQAIDALLEAAGPTGAAALSLIPDRNYTPGVRDRKLQNLYDVVALAERIHFPVFVGTEMNAPGNKFADDFEAAELQPIVSVFLEGANIAFAHSVLQPGGFGYLSAWAATAFPSIAAKNEFFAAAGRMLRADWGQIFTGLPSDAAPASVLRKIEEDSVGK
jgi:hypothetical protein